MEFSFEDIDEFSENQNPAPESPDTVRQDSKTEPSIDVPEQTDASTL